MGNVSFCRAYEKWVGRKPFILKGISYPAWKVLGQHGKTQGRLTIGAEFTWQSERVFVTSFDDDKNSLVACAYHPNEDGMGLSSKIKKRFRINYQDFVAERKLRKAFDDGGQKDGQ